jgi:hypothetical protein
MTIRPGPVSQVVTVAVNVEDDRTHVLTFVCASRLNPDWCHRTAAIEAATTCRLRWYRVSLLTAIHVVLFDGQLVCLGVYGNANAQDSVCVTNVHAPCKCRSSAPLMLRCKHRITGFPPGLNTTLAATCRSFVRIGIGETIWIIRPSRNHPKDAVGLRLIKRTEGYVATNATGSTGGLRYPATPILCESAKKANRKTTRVLSYCPPGRVILGGGIACLQYAYKRIRHQRTLFRLRTV